MGKLFRGLFNKRKKSKKLIAEQPPSEKAPSSLKPSSTPSAPNNNQKKPPGEDDNVIDSSALTEESTSARSEPLTNNGGSLSNHNSTLNVILQSPDEFEEDKMAKEEECVQREIKHNIVDLDESLGDDEDDVVMEEDQAIFAALSDDELDDDDDDGEPDDTNIADEKNLDTLQKGVEDKQPEQEGDLVEEDEQDVLAPSTIGTDDENGAMSNVEAAEYYDYGDGAPSIPQDFTETELDEETMISADENDIPADAEVEPEEAAPSTPNSPDSEDNEKEISTDGYHGASPSSSHHDIPVQIPLIQPSEGQPAAEAESEASHAAKLYQAKRNRLKQRRTSMTTAEQRTERAAARKNSLLLKKFLQKEMSEEDDYIQTHLGCDDKGKCLRHPNMTIVGKVKEFRFETVFSCKVCASEQKAGGIARQRKSMCMVIGDIKSMQKDRKSWRNRTKVMHHGKEYDSDEDSYEESKSDSSQSLDSLERITGFFADDADHDELTRSELYQRDDAWKEKVTGRVAQVRGWDGKAALKCNPVFAKYFRMVSLGVPPEAVKQACEFDGWDPRVMDLDPNRPLLDQLYSTRTWKKSEKEDLLLNIRLCMGQESTEEEAGDSLLEITDNVFEAYCKKKESIELHRQEVKRQEEAQQWIGSGVSLLKKASSRRVAPSQKQAKGKKVEPKQSGTKIAASTPSKLSKESNQTVSRIGKNAAEKESAEAERAGPQQAEQSKGTSRLPLRSKQGLAIIGETSEREEESESNSIGEYKAPQPAESPMVAEVEKSEKGSQGNETLLPLSDVDEQAEVSPQNGTKVNGEVATAKDNAKDEKNESNESEVPSLGVIEQTGDLKSVEIEATGNLEDADGEGSYQWSDDEVEFPLDGGGKARDEPMLEGNKSIDLEGKYSVAADGASDDEMYDSMAFNESQNVDWDGDGSGIIEGPIDIPSKSQSPDDDDMSVVTDMTGESWKKSKRSSQRRSRRKETENARTLLEKKDIVVASLVAKVERLQQELVDQNIIESDNVRIMEKELHETKQLIAEKDAIAVALEKQIKRQEYEANEKWRIVEEQTTEILRLKEQLAAVGLDADDVENKSRKDSKSSSSNRNGTSSKSKERSSSSKDNKRSSKDSKSGSESKSSKKSKPGEENLDRAHLRAVFKKSVRKLIIITRSFNQTSFVDKEMSADRKSFRRSSTKMKGWVAPSEWNDYLTDDEEDGDSKPPRPPPPPTSASPSPRTALQKSLSLQPVRSPGAMMGRKKRGAASVLLSKDARIPMQRIEWRDDDNICKVMFAERIPDNFKKDLFYTPADIQRFRIDKYMEDHEDDFELVEEDDADYSEELIEEEIEYIDEEIVVDDDGVMYIEEEIIVEDDEYFMGEEAVPVRRVSMT